MLKTKNDTVVLKKLRRNTAYVQGIIKSIESYSDHLIVALTVKRTSNNEDTVLAYVHNVYLTAEVKKNLHIGKMLYVEGELKTRHISRITTTIYIFVKDMYFPHIDDEQANKSDSHINEVKLQGWISTAPIKRYTPYGRKLNELTLKVYRRNEVDNADYFPLITWESCDEIAKEIRQKSHIEVYGRIQSKVVHNKREQKDINSYYISVYKITILPKYKKKNKNKKNVEEKAVEQVG
jgi:primosomal replication protein N